MNKDDDEVLKRQVVGWQIEIKRLQDLIAVATGNEQPDLGELLNLLLDAVATAAAKSGDEDAADIIVSDADAKEQFIQFSKQVKELTGIEMGIMNAGSRNGISIRLIATRSTNS